MTVQLILGYCGGFLCTEASSVATTLQAPAPATKLQDSIGSSSSSNEAANNKAGVQRKRGIPNDGWVGLPSAYGLGQPWDQSPWRPIKGPSLQFDTSSWQYGSGGLGSLGSLGSLAGWPSKDIPRQVPLVVTKHVLVEKPVTVEKVVHVPVERIVHKAVPVGIPVPHAVPVHISHAVPLPIRHAVPVPYHQPYPVPVRQPIPYAVPVPIPYPVHHNGYPAQLHRNYQSPLGGLYAPYLAQQHHAGAAVAAIKHGLPGYQHHHHHHQHLGLHHQHQHQAPIHAANLHGWAGHRLVPPPVYLGHDFSGGQQHHLHYGHHHQQQQLLLPALHHHQQHHHLGHQLVAAASEQQQQRYHDDDDDDVDNADEDEDKKSKRSNNGKSRTESGDVSNVDDKDEKN